jgi:hypothetical protein
MQSGQSNGAPALEKLGLHARAIILLAGAPDPEVIWLAARSETAPFELPARTRDRLALRGDYNLRGRTPKADAPDVCLKGKIAVSQ